MAKKSTAEASRQNITVRVKLGDRATIIDPDTDLEHEPGSTVTLDADWQGTPLSQHWRRALAQNSCSIIVSTKSKGSA